MSDAMYTCSFYGETDMGLVRTNNEDTLIFQKIWDDKHILCAAIDGLGGYEGGEVAAEIARLSIIKHLEEFASKKVGDLMREAMIVANNEIISQHSARPKVAQMGCVASVGLIDLEKGILTIAHVGDSRIYKYADGALNKLTHDHSLVGYREEIGEMSEEDAMHHPKRNVIDKFLGEQYLSADSADYIEISAWPITGNMQVLYCSDGLTDMITSAQIIQVLSADMPIETKVKQLIAKAKEAGGKDNVTVVIADIAPIANKTIAPPAEEEQPKTDAKTEVKVKTKDHKIMFGFILGLIVGAAGCLAYFYYNSKKNAETYAALKATTKATADSLQAEIDSLNNVIINLLPAEGVNEHDPDSDEPTDQDS